MLAAMQVRSFSVATAFMKTEAVQVALFGLIVLGSSDPERFRSGMGTALLERIADTAAAALSRLAE